MRKSKLFLGVVLTIVCLLCSFAFVACKPDEQKPIEPTGGTLTISQTTAQLDLHEQVQLSVTEAGETKWKSENTAVCTVENGLVKSVGVGVTAVTASQGDKKATCTVTVTNSRAAAQIALTEGNSTVSEKICTKGEEFTLNADVTYKKASVPAGDVAELQWSVDDGAVLSLDVSADKKSAKIVCSKYGVTTVRVATTVWGEPISRAIEVCVRNTAVTFSSADWEQDDEEVYYAEMDAVDETGAAITKAINIVCKDGEKDVSDQVKWSVSDENVAVVDGASLTAVAADTVTLTGEYQGNFVTAEITVTKPTFKLAKQTVSLFDGEGGALRATYPTAEEVQIMRAQNVTLRLPDTVAGTVSAFNIAYKQVVGNNTEEVTRNILTATDDADAHKISIRPSFYSFNMGEKTASVVTEKAIYELPLELYTMIIDSKEELDAFRYYTTYQNEWKETTTAGEFAPILWDGYFVLGDNIEYNASVAAYANETNLANYNAVRKYESFITNKDVIPFFGEGNELNSGLSGNKAGTVGDYGFCGVFDGKGYNIQGLIVANAEVTADGKSGDLAQVGGFIGMLTGRGDLCFGTIKNVSFTDVVHTRFDNGGVRYGTTGGFLFSVAHGPVCVENINIEVEKMAYTDSLIGSRLWYTQMYGKSVFSNVMVHVKNYASNPWNRGTKETHNRTEQSWIFSYIVTYDPAVFANSYAVVDTIANHEGDSLEKFKGSAFAAPLYRDDYGKADNDPTKTFVQDTPADTVPADLFGTVDALKTYIGEKESRKDGWTAEYWDLSSGTPVFKTQTND